MKPYFFNYVADKKNTYSSYIFAITFLNITSQRT